MMHGSYRRRETLETPVGEPAQCIEYTCRSGSLVAGFRAALLLFSALPLTEEPRRLPSAKSSTVYGTVASKGIRVGVSNSIMHSEKCVA